MLVDILISVGGIALLVALAWWLGRGRARPPLDPESAMAIAEQALVDFDAHHAVIDGRAARVLDKAGRAAIVKPHGDHWTVRLV